MVGHVKTAQTTATSTNLIVTAQAHLGKLICKLIAKRPVISVSTDQVISLSFISFHSFK